jgi:FAD/FMN-containing dehydrogenase
MTGGPLTEQIVLSFTRHMNHMLHIGEDSASAEPGMYYKDFEKETLKHGWYMPSYPASRELCALGGMVANNCGGEKTLTYGKIENYVKELEMVLDDGSIATFGMCTEKEFAVKKALQTREGEIYRELSELITTSYDVLQNAKPKVSKNSSGYTLWNVYDKDARTFNIAKLIVGSQGTLGIITKITLTGVKPKKYSRLLISFLPSLIPVADITKTLLSFTPETLESYDDQTFNIALKFFFTIIKQLKGNFFTLAWQFLPEFWMVVTGGVPKLIIMAEFTGDSLEEINIRMEKAYQAMQKYNIKLRKTDSESEVQKYWTFRRQSFNLLRSKLQGVRTAPFIDDITVRPEVLPVFLPRLQALLKEYPLTYTIAGHVGDGNFHIIPLMDLSKKKSIIIIRELADKVFELTLEFKGSQSGEHNDGLIRTPFLSYMFTQDILQLFQKTKDIFDPADIFNPRKKVRGDIFYSFAHIDTSKKKLEEKTYLPC